MIQTLELIRSLPRDIGIEETEAIIGVADSRRLVRWFTRYSGSVRIKSTLPAVAIIFYGWAKANAFFAGEHNAESSGQSRQNIHIFPEILSTKIFFVYKFENNIHHLLLEISAADYLQVLQEKHIKLVVTSILPDQLRLICRQWLISVHKISFYMHNMILVA